MLLLLSGDISLNPGPTPNSVSQSLWKSFENKGLHFLHFFFLCIQFTLFKTKMYSHQALIYLNVPRIPLRKPLKNKQIVQEQ